MHATFRRRHPALSLLSLALLAALAAPAFAADPPCLDANGDPVPAAPTNQGSEHGTDNTTCAGTASAYGYNNNASGAASSA